MVDLIRLDLAFELAVPLSPQDAQDVAGGDAERAVPEEAGEDTPLRGTRLPQAHCSNNPWRSAATSRCYRFKSATTAASSGTFALCAIMSNCIVAVPAEQPKSLARVTLIPESPVELMACPRDASIHRMICALFMINREKLPLRLPAAFAFATIGLDGFAPDPLVLCTGCSASTRSIKPVPLASWREEVKRFPVVR